MKKGIKGEQGENMIDMLPEIKKDIYNHFSNEISGEDRTGQPNFGQLAILFIVVVVGVILIYSSYSVYPKGTCVTYFANGKDSIPDIGNNVRNCNDMYIK